MMWRATCVLWVAMCVCDVHVVMGGVQATAGIRGRELLPLLHLRQAEEVTQVVAVGSDTTTHMPEEGQGRRVVANITPGATSSSASARSGVNGSATNNSLVPSPRDVSSPRPTRRPSEKPCRESNACVDVGLGMCTGRGRCCSGKCRCAYGYSGDTCEVAEFELCPNACSGHGIRCEDGECVCQEGFEGKSCNRPMLCSDVAFCSGHGTCQNSNGTCLCDDGWKGLMCNQQVVCPDGCSGRGWCNSSSGECQCNRGFIGVNCGRVRQPSICPDACSAHGLCTASGTCDCDFGFRGPSCSIVMDLCPCRHGICTQVDDGAECLCKKGWKGNRCDELDVQTTVCSSMSSTSRNSTALCSGHGICAETNEANAVCVCDEGSGGIGCGKFLRSVCNHTCSGHGRCDDPVKTCLCIDGFRGSSCAEAPCPVSMAGLVCDGHGVCDASAHTLTHAITHKCTCDVGYNGSDCSIVQQMATNCPNGCSDHGVCKPDTVKCDCFEDYTGDDCGEYVGPVEVENLEAPDASEFA